MNAVPFVVRLHHEREVDISKYQQSLQPDGIGVLPLEEADALLALNILLCHDSKCSPTKKVYLNNKTFSIENVKGVGDLTGGLQALPGYFSSIRPATGGLLANINTKTGVFYKSGRLDILMNDWKKARDIEGRSNASSLLNDLQDFVKGLRIQAMHKTSKIDGQGNLRPWIRQVCGLANTKDGESSCYAPRLNEIHSNSCPCKLLVQRDHADLPLYRAQFER